MKMRKVILDGYIELVPSLFGGRRNRVEAVTVNIEKNFISFSMGIVKRAKLSAEIGGDLNATVAIHKSKDKFIIVFEEDGKFRMRKSNKVVHRISNAGLIEGLIQCGFESKRYKAESPEDGVIVVTKEEA